MTISTQYAETHLDDLLAAAENGQEVKITRPGRPSIKLVVDETVQEPKRHITGRKYLFGAWAGLVTLPTEDEWKAMDKEIESEMLDGSIVPPEHV